MTSAWRLHLGDCADGLTGLASASVDALITDPPAGIGFMGKGWDGDKGGRDAWVSWMAGIMRECLRVLKPGAHGLVWALPRTSHWTATALEDAGFEIRDVITHHFGTGFPKSLDVSKAIDGAAGAEREVLPDPQAARRNKTPRALAPGEAPRQAMASVTAPATPAAQQWAGWGTALKPASEHWILVRKPLDGTVAENVQRHGVGGLNIDGCRIEGASRPLVDATLHVIEGDGRFGTMGGSRAAGVTNVGRWPANLVLTHGPDCGEACAPGCPVAEMDAQSGVLTSGSRAEGVVSTLGFGPTGVTGDYLKPELAGSTGGASRFFYCAKPSREERDTGCATLPARNGGEATGRKDGAAALSSPRTGAGRTGGARNDHPTVKATKLMEWLIRLITPPGAQLLILDPFAGSGTTGVAAVRLRHQFVGWEREPGYHEIGERRLAAAQAETQQMWLFGQPPAAT